MKREILAAWSIVLLLLPLTNAVSFSNSSSNYSCKCVAFRLDDVQDNILDDVNMKIIKVFEEKNASLTLGIVGNLFGHDKKLISFIRDAISSNGSQVDISNHGWNHEDFRRFNIHDQSLLITNTNERINRILGVTPTIFIAPFDVFNNDTLVALKENGIKYISSFIDYDPGPYGIVENRIPYHLPSKATTSDNNDTFWWGINHTDTLKQIEKSNARYGFSVVEMHPYEYSNKHDYHSKPFDINDTKSTFSYRDYINNWDKAGIDQKQVKELKLLIDQVRAKGYNIVPFDRINFRVNQSSDNS